MIKDHPKAIELSLFIKFLGATNKCITDKIIINNKISINMILAVFRLYIIKYNLLVILNLNLTVNKFFIKGSLIDHISI